MKQFTHEEQIIILEIANLALTDKDQFMRIADLMDLSDGTLGELHDKIIQSLS